MDPREGIRGAVGQITRMMLCLDRGQGAEHPKLFFALFWQKIIS